MTTKNAHVHSSIIHMSQRIEVIQISMKGWVDEQNVVETYSEILFGLKMEVGTSLAIQGLRPCLPMQGIRL